MLPDIEATRDDEERKWWRATELPRELPTLSVGYTAMLKCTARIMLAANRLGNANTLRRLVHMLLALQTLLARRCIADDLQLLMDAQDMLHLVRPAVKIDPGKTWTIRASILSPTLDRIRYVVRGRMTS